MIKRSTSAVVVVLFLGNILFGQSIPLAAYSGMKWRSVGPYRAGWATMAEGIPNEPNTFYFGAAGGGIWKTSDAGRTWLPLMQHEKASSIGALAIAPSDSKIIYAGTGQVAFRYDILAGNGVYRSDDAGTTWKNIGLKETRYIGRIVVDPHDPNKIIVAALGHMFEPNHERGIFLTTDGGNHWQQTLYVNDSTGAVDLACDPTTPEILYAALWQVRMHPWLDYFMPGVGPGSGIYKSTDEGQHWKKLEGNGLPGGSLGRIGLAAARGSHGKMVYATIEVHKGKSGLYQSTDAGESWNCVNEDAALVSSYFSRLTVDPLDPELLYVMGRSIRYSDDGGKSFDIIKGSPGGDDYHFLWINPLDRSHMITASDQGAVVTVNGGKSWSSWYNQPTGQFYHVAADDQFPYHIYSGQQDNGTVGMLSQGPYGVIELRDWHPVGGDERDYDIPKPGNPTIVFGTGLGGPISRFNEITRQVALVSPWPVSSYGARLTTVRYRYTWITPLAFSPIKPYPMYFGSQYLFKSTNDGDTWAVISPDLSRKKEGSKDYDNADRGQAADAGYGVIFTIAPSPTNPNIIWVGTDDGLIQRTSDGGKHWNNVTPPSVPLWSRIDALSQSPFSEQTEYAAVNTHRLGIFSPIILKTTNNGAAWKTIINGLPDDEYVNSVRCDPVTRRLLYASTNCSVYVSFDDGDHWQALSLNLPTACVNDILVHDNDLIAATQGRGIWILDDLAPLREMTRSLTEKNAYLFAPAPAWRLRGSENRDTPWPPETPLGQNPPTGGMIDYWLKDTTEGPVLLTIKDSHGHVIRTFESDAEPEDHPSDRYFPKEWIGDHENISSGAGMHRFVWDLRYETPKALRYEYSITAVWDDDTPLDPRGALVLPGTYTVTLSVNGKKYSQPLVVKMDPRVHVNPKDLQKQLSLALQVDSVLMKTVGEHRKINEMLKEKKGTLSPAETDSLTAIANSGATSFSSVAGVLTGLITTVQSADAAPTQGQMNVFKEYKNQFDNLLHRLEKLRIH